MVRIDKDKCLGCGICENICPKGIEIEAGIAIIKNANIGCLKDAAKACPTNAILLNENNENNE